MNVHERKISPPNDPLIFKKKILLHSGENLELENQNIIKNNQDIKGFEKYSIPKSNDVKSNDNEILIQDIICKANEEEEEEEKKEEKKEKKECHTEATKNILNMICENKTFESELIEDIKLNNARINAESKMESEHKFENPKVSNSNR